MSGRFPPDTVPVSTKAQRDKPYRPLPKLLKQLREEAGLSQRDLGELLGKPQSWVYNCETANRRVDVSEFVAWSGACGVDPVRALRRFMGSKG